MPRLTPVTPLTPLKIDAHVASVRDALARRRAAVVTAPPGAGKTTRVPPALLDAGPAILLQPRRVATRSVAKRIALERGWSIGREIGWQIRFEKRFSRDTQLLVVTEGILTGRLQHDPLLSDFATIILDEFHERSIHADIGLALARQAWLARPDLRIVVMSATLDAGPVSAYLNGAPVIDVQSPPHALSVEYAPGEPVGGAVRRLLPRTNGQILCFLPGVREIDRARADLRLDGVEVVPLHGSLDADDQDAAIASVAHRRVILATNIAETSLTVPGVSAVVDAGYVKIARYDADRAIDSLTLERITLDSADQRAGRAARLGPGIAMRLWDQRDRLRSHREPEIARVDLSGPLLDVIAWGADPRSFEWFEAPDVDRVDTALSLLRQLGALDAGLHVTSLGRQLQRLPLHPRLARILLDGRGAPEAAVACARLSEGSIASGDSRAQQIANELQRLARAVLGDAAAGHISDDVLRHALFTGYADRLAKRRSGSSSRYLMASGHGAALAREAESASSEYIVALDVVAAERDGINESRIRAASSVEREWIEPTSVELEHAFDAQAGRVRAARVERCGSIVLSQTPVQPDPSVAAALLRDVWLQRPYDDDVMRLVRRLKFAAIVIDLGDLVAKAALAASRIDDINAAALQEQLPYNERRLLQDRAPESILVPSGRRMALEYAEDGSVSTSVKLQEMFGLAESPVIGPSRVPVTLQLLAPNGRPVQTTRDLRSFWERTYPEVRKELRGRYPKHPWPENPWSAPPTHRTVRKQ